MKVEWTKLTLLMCTAVLVVSCGPKKNEEPAPEAKKMEAPQPSPQQEQSTLTPKQKDELEIDEDNVMNPFPG